MAERELRRYGVSLSRSQRDGSLDKAAASLGFRIGDDVLVAIGYGKVAPDQVVRLLVPEDKLATPAGPGVTSRLTEIFRKVARRPAGGVRISGIEDVLVRYGKCCNPVPGTPSWDSSPGGAASPCTPCGARRGSPWIRSGASTSPGT